MPQVDRRERARAELLRQALSSDDPLPAVREAIEENNDEQRVVVWTFGAILDTNSAGFPVLLDRFDDVELNLIEGALEAIGASQSLGALRRLRLGGSSQDRLASTHELVKEMETRLLGFCQTNLDKLSSVSKPRAGRSRNRAK